MLQTLTKGGSRLCRKSDEAEGCLSPDVSLVHGSKTTKATRGSVHHYTRLERFLLKDDQSDPRFSSSSHRGLSNILPPKAERLTWTLRRRADSEGEIPRFPDNASFSRNSSVVMTLTRPDSRSLSKENSSRRSTSWRAQPTADEPKRTPRVQMRGRRTRDAAGEGGTCRFYSRRACSSGGAAAEELHRRVKAARTDGFISKQTAIPYSTKHNLVLSRSFLHYKYPDGAHRQRLVDAR